jgi:hypothetical protein
VQNYLYYGLEPTPVKGSGYGEKESGAYVNYNFEKAKNRILAKYRSEQPNKNNIPRNKIQEIENFMSGASSSENNVFLSSALAKILEENMNIAAIELNEKGDKILSQYFKVNEYGGVESFVKKGKKDIEIKKASMQNIFKKDERENKRQYETVKKSILQLKKQVESNEGILTQEEIKYITRQLAICMGKISKFSKKSNKKGELIGRKLINFEDPSIKGEVEFLNLVTYLFSTIPSSAMICKAGEYGVSLGALAAFEDTEILVNEKINDVFKNNEIIKGNTTVRLVGTEQSERKFNELKFAKGLNIKELISQNEVSKVSVDKKGQGKTDVIIEINENGVKKLSHLSVKNYNLTNKHYVTMGTYSSLLLMLQQIAEYGGGDLVNHWLNITSTHHGSPDSRRFGKDNSLLPSDWYLESHNAMKAILTVLCAGGLNKEIDYLVVNNNHFMAGSKNQVKIIPINNVITYLINAKLENMQHIVSVKTGKDKLMNMSSDGKNLWRNEWSGGQVRDKDEAKKRISLLLAELHSINMKASLNPVATLNLMGNEINSKNYY